MIYLRLSLLAALVLCLGCTDSGGDGPETSACGVLGLETRSGLQKIAQGTECSRNNSPVVNVTILPVDGGVGICTGTMISIRHVLTAAHCFTSDIASVSVQVAGIDVGVSQIQNHPQFNADTIPFQNDVAILTLQSDALVPPLPLILSKTLQPDDIISIFGYGNDEDSTNGILRSGEMKVTGINSQFFTADFEDDGSNTCQGDSGGPAILSFRDDQGTTRTGIIGITSFGQLPCNESGISGFQYIQSNAVVNFITSAVPGVAIQ